MNGSLWVNPKGQTFDQKFLEDIVRNVRTKYAKKIKHVEVHPKDFETCKVREVLGIPVYPVSSTLRSHAFVVFDE